MPSRYATIQDSCSTSTHYLEVAGQPDGKSSAVGVELNDLTWRCVACFAFLWIRQVVVRKLLIHAVHTVDCLVVSAHRHRLEYDVTGDGTMRQLSTMPRVTAQLSESSYCC